MLAMVGIYSFLGPLASWHGAWRRLSSRVHISTYFIGRCRDFWSGQQLEGPRSGHLPFWELRLASQLKDRQNQVPPSLARTSSLQSPH